jgi:hypothetical protein
VILADDIFGSIWWKWSSNFFFPLCLLDAALDELANFSLSNSKKINSKVRN